MTRRGQHALQRRYALLLAVAALVLVLDQLSKAAVTDHLRGRSAVTVLGGLLRLDYARNTGAAFSVLPNGGILFEVVAAVVCVAILVGYARLHDRALVLRIALALIFGGALGNLVDRVRLGYVVDFVDLRWWPVFNLADSAIVVGVCLVALHGLVRQQET